MINQIAKEIKEQFIHEASGHDWWHIYRVWNLSKKIAKIEGGNLNTIEAGALLHDIADWKFHNGDEDIGPKRAAEILFRYKADKSMIEAVQTIIKEISFKGSGVDTPMSSLEGAIVQDADRLDAIGAIGIARTFAYGGVKGQVIYQPEIKPILHQNFESYKNSKGPSINHFFEKLLLLKDRMNTSTGKKIAEKRHAFMEEYLSRFFEEWG